MSSKKKAPKQKVADYLLSIHMGVCIGVVDAIRKITIGEKTVWEGTQTANTTLGISKPDLFGGSEKEGGVSGSVDVYMGANNQVMTSAFASRFGLTPANIPAFRGMLSVFFYGSGSTGFKWSTNSPYIKNVAMTVFRKSLGLSSTKSTIQTTVYVPDDPATTESETATYIVDDLNPADMIYESLTNTEWGSGASPAEIDSASFVTAQSTLYDEKFGLSMIWVRQSKVESFIQEILGHINGLVFVNPQTGLWTLKLIRADYDESTLRHVTPENAQMTSFQRKLWGETINEIVATWTNPANEQEETVSAQDLANIAMQGGIVSDSRNYYGVRSASLAMFLAMRDVRSSSSPLTSGELVLDRSFWDILPGDCIKLYWPEEGISGLVMRVMKADYGKPGDSKIKLTVLEDVFSLQAGAFVEPPRTLWTGTSKTPEPITNAKIMGVPFYFLELELGATDAALVEYPETANMILASRPNSDTYGYDLWAEIPEPSGTLAFSSVGGLTPITTALLDSALVFEATSIAAFANMSGPDIPYDSTFVVIGSKTTADDSCEIAMVMSVGLTTWTLRRGLFDTIPRAWPVGTPLWFFRLDSPIGDPSGWAAGQTARYKLISKTSLGSLSDLTAPIETFLTGPRPVLPIRPAKVTVAGVLDGEVSVADGPNIAVSWSNRNRFSESAPPMGWLDATTTLEAGQTTSIFVERIDGTPFAEHTGLTSSSFSLPIASFGALSQGYVRVASVRDGLESLQSKKILVKIIGRDGYGYTYGENYGGQP